MESTGEGEGYLPLFETKQAKGQNVYRLFSLSRFVELWFGLYWVVTQSIRWNSVCRYTFKDRLSNRFEDKLPGVDIFVCTADATIEPPMMVINTVLSVMAYNYPSEKLSVYLSDDGGSDLTFYALLEASHFAKHWIPFCKNFNIEPRSPAAYFSTKGDPLLVDSKALSSIKKLYEEMEYRIETASKLGRIPEDIRIKHKGFSEWDSVSSPRDHQTILQVLIDRRNPSAVDSEGGSMPTLVYLAREKRPNHPHNFKAGAMNALIRVSSKISNEKIILNVDCDMYSNNSDTVRDSLCFFMDERKGHEIAFVQFPQCFINITKNDIYGGSLTVICEYGCPVEDVITGLSIHCRGWKSIYCNPTRKGFLGVAPATLAQTLVQHKRWAEGTSTAQSTAIHSAAVTNFTSNSWSFKGNEVGGSSQEMPRDFGLGQVSQSMTNHFSGELEIAQQGDRQYVELRNSRGYGSSTRQAHWSL
ncbi:hypothetical protein IFM89_030128 [Coptis chinensis]|uniref:Uncharacterized protein n=1 Tax=Coptis chinensis TaxID=261450 RepID=A0A835I673_9MAGN|nr:hypothetical protein IFM89_030128 [Coptis chinensis]